MTFSRPAGNGVRRGGFTLVELLVVAGFYRLVSGFLNSAGIQLDDGVPGFPT